MNISGGDSGAGFVDQDLPLLLASSLFRVLPHDLDLNCEGPLQALLPSSLCCFIFWKRKKFLQCFLSTCLTR